MTMPIDFTTYNPPGIYIQDDTTPFISPVGSTGPEVIAIVGPSIGYRRADELVTLNGTTDARLVNLGIDVSSVIVRATDGTEYDVLDDYVLTAGAGEDAQIGETEDNTLDIKRNDAGAITDGEEVFVSYQYTDTAYLLPRLYLNFEDVKDHYGEPLDSVSSAIVSPLTLAAQLAFQNGARRILAVPVEGTATAVTRDALSDGLTRLEAYPCDIVVVLPVGLTGTEVAPGDTINVANDLRAHVQLMSGSGENLFRTGIIGYETTVTALSSTIAAGVNDERVMIAFPNAMSYYNGFVNETFNISGYYLAAAYAGMFAALPVNEGITRKTVRGFNGIPVEIQNTMSRILKDAYSSAGVAVTERTRDQRLLVRHGTSTNPSSINTREFSLVRARDALISAMYETFDRGALIGTPIEEDTLARIKGVAQGVLETAVINNVINGYNGVAVRQRTIDPTVVEVKFQYLPAFPLNYIVIVFSINLSTGETDLFSQNP